MADIQFEKLCQVFEELVKNKKDQHRILSNFINEIKIESKRTGNKVFSLFPVLRLLLPNLERERCAYNLKESKLGKLLIKVLSLPKNSPDEQKLTNFRTVKNSKEGSDFASVAYFVLNNRVGQKMSKLTIGEINESLDKIASAEVGNKGPILDEAFTYIVKNATARQAKWFLRIVLKDLKLGIGKGKILSAVHPDAPEYYESCSSLSKLCEELDEGNTRPLELGIELFTAVSPMLSERLDVTSIAKLPQDKSHLVEIKFDGERFQMHMQDGVFEYFSRRGFTYSSKFGKTYDCEGLLTPLLKGSFKPGVNSFILDGEMMGWHKERECFGSKGMSYDIKKMTETSKYRPCFCVFDILYYNGKTLVGHPDKGGIPLSDRLGLLDAMFTDVPGVIQHSKRELVKNNADIFAAFNKARANAEEGIVLKECDSYYIANRRNAGWYKIKPEYTEGTLEDLDLVIIGADYAENKKQGLARSFVVACLDRSDSGTRWVSIGRAATGLTFEERERVCNALQLHWRPTAQAAPPVCLVFNKERPDLWIMPEKSIVLTVRATELIRSNTFGTDYTLQFPRIERIRDDKPVGDVMTLQEFNGLAANKGPVVKLSTKQINLEDIEASTLKPRRKRPAKVLEVADQFRTKTEGVEATSMALSGKKICVLSDDEDFSKAELEALVVTHGGIVVQNITPTTSCCIVGRTNMRVRNAIASAQADIIPSAWLRSLEPSPEPTPPPHPLDYLAMTAATKMKLSREYDPYGDSYTEPVDEDFLRRCFDKMDRDKEPEIHLTSQEIIDLDKELFGDINPSSFLRACFLHFTDETSLLALKARLFGATLCSVESPNLTHVVVTKKGGEENVLEIKEKATVPVVSEDWLKKCFLENELVSEISFSL